jgi:hypothetical protein
LRRRFQYKALLFEQSAIDHCSRFRRGGDPTRQAVQFGAKYHVHQTGHPRPSSGGAVCNIVWDAAIEHFTEKKIDTIMGAIVERLGADGILSGYTLTEDKTGKKSNALHEYEFKDKEDLRRFFTPHFKFVRVWDTIYPTRHNLYFVASQTPVEMYG